MSISDVPVCWLREAFFSFFSYPFHGQSFPIGHESRSDVQTHGFRVEKSKKNIRRVRRSTGVRDSIVDELSEATDIREVDQRWHGLRDNSCSVQFV